MAIPEDRIIFGDVRISAKHDGDDLIVTLKVKPAGSRKQLPPTVIRFQRVGTGFREIRFEDGGAGNRTLLTQMAEGHLIASSSASRDALNRRLGR